MSSSHLHNTDQLFELAGLDALALLDEQEAAFFERAFFAAPASAQRQIRELQASIVADPLFHADVQPPTALAEQVLRRVRAEIERSESELSPLAVIGRSMNSQQGRDGAGLDDERNVRRRFFAGFGSATLWRAASLVLAAGLLTTFVFLYQAVETNQTIMGLMGVNGISSANRAVVSAKGWAAMVNANRYVTLMPTSPESRDSAVATVAVDDATGVVTVMAYGLSTTSEPYVIRAINPTTGAVAFEKALAFDGGAFGAIVELSTRSMPALLGVKFEIVDKAGAVVLA